MVFTCRTSQGHEYTRYTGCISQRRAVTEGVDLGISLELGPSFLGPWHCVPSGAETSWSWLPAPVLSLWLWLLGLGKSSPPSDPISSSRKCGSDTGLSYRVVMKCCMEKQFVPLRTRIVITAKWRSWLWQSPPGFIPWRLWGSRPVSLSWDFPFLMIFTRLSGLLLVTFPYIKPQRLPVLNLSFHPGLFSLGFSLCQHSLYTHVSVSSVKFSCELWIQTSSFSPGISVWSPPTQPHTCASLSLRVVLSAAGKFLPVFRNPTQLPPLCVSSSLLPENSVPTSDTPLLTLALWLSAGVLWSQGLLVTCV